MGTTISATEMRLTHDEGRDAARLIAWRLMDIAEEIGNCVVPPRLLARHHETVCTIGELSAFLPDPDQKPETGASEELGCCRVDERAAAMLRESAFWAIHWWGTWIEEMARSGELRPAHHEHCADKVATARRVLLALGRAESDQ